MKKTERERGDKKKTTLPDDAAGRRFFQRGGNDTERRKCKEKERGAVRLFQSLSFVITRLEHRIKEVPLHSPFRAASSFLSFEIVTLSLLSLHLSGSLM